jgi:hypothetical protein
MRVVVLDDEDAGRRRRRVRQAQAHLTGLMIDDRRRVGSLRRLG